ncbi:MAG: DUF4230 domain-containing protein [Oscillospiraceae bacterium]|nr:DUF4230 domain-containing protein [Oscillospiraceae bacterium]
MKKLKIALAVLLAFVIVGVGAFLLGRSAQRGAVLSEEESGSGVVTEHEEISGETIRSGMTDIGELATEEYWFTQVQTYDSTKSAQIFDFSFDLPLTRNKFVYSYDGVIKAGVDFAAASVEVDNALRRVTVTLPKARILSSEIDYDSFELYDEQKSIFNPLSVRDVNKSDGELLRSAEKDAIAKGVLTRADENAETLVVNFLRGAFEVRSYAIKVEHLS